MYNFYIFYILFIYLYILYIFYIFIYMHALYLPYDYISLHLYILHASYPSLYIRLHLYIIYILCITSAEGDLSLRDKHLSVVFSLRSKPNKQFNVSFHNYSLGKKFYIHIYIILVEFFTNPLLNTLS